MLDADERWSFCHSYVTDPLGHDRLGGVHRRVGALSDAVEEQLEARLPAGDPVFLNEGQAVEDATFQEIEVFLGPDRSFAPCTPLELEVGRHLHGELRVALVGDAFVNPIEHSGRNAPLSLGLVQLEASDFAAMGGDELQTRLERRHRGGVAEDEGTRPRVFIANDLESHVGRYHSQERRTIGEIRHEQCSDSVLFLG